MIAHATLRKLPLFVVRSKLDAYSLEGSRESLTSWLRELGLASFVINRWGEGYEPERWDRSRTLWQGDQEGLLVADNQTLNHMRTDLAHRRLLSVLAWGTRADPEPSRLELHGPHRIVSG